MGHVSGEVFVFFSRGIRCGEGRDLSAPMVAAGGQGTGRNLLLGPLGFLQRTLLFRAAPLLIRVRRIPTFLIIILFSPAR